MANRRIEVFQLRDAITRMRLGESDRRIRDAGIMGRTKAAELRRLAGEQGWLEKDAPMPSNEVIAEMLQRPRQNIAESLVTPYRDRVLKWSEQGLTATAIHQALVRRHGFTGAYNSVKRFIASHKSPKSPTIILEHKPGIAAQVDFGAGPKLVDSRTGEVRKTWFFVMTLAYSKHQYVEFVWDQRVETWLGCHRRAFEHFGGVPRKVVIDNPKCAIVRAYYREPEVQRSYAELAEAYGFILDVCPVGQPQKKGVVESGVKYVKSNFLPLREFRGLSDLNRQVLEWVLGLAGNRIHGTTKARPLTRFAEVERSFLTPLPDKAPELVVWHRVRLHGDCHVHFEKCRYSAPFKLVRANLWLRATEKLVQLYRGLELVAVHPRLFVPGAKSSKMEHLPLEAQAYLMADPQWCLEQAAKVGDSCLELVETLFADRVLDKLRAAQGVIKLGNKYGKLRLEAACFRALRHSSPTYRTVKEILEKGLDQEPPTASLPGLSPAYQGKGRFAASAMH